MKRGEVPHGLKESHQEAFCWDSDLVCITRQRYFEAHHPSLHQEGSHDLSGLFWEMITSVDLVDSKIYEIQEVWTRQKDLQYANHALKEFVKGSAIFLSCIPFGITKGHGPKRDSSFQCTPLPCGIIILPMVQKGRAK